MTTTTEAYSWTVDDVLALKPCKTYARKRIRALFAGRERLTIRDVCDLDIPTADRLWLLCRAPWPLIEPAITRIVGRAVRTYALPYNLTRAWAERWLSGEDRAATEAPRAAEAAWAAWREAAGAAAAWAAPRPAAAAARAAVAAAWARAAEAAWAAVAAARARAAEAERARQIDDFRALEGE